MRHPHRTEDVRIEDDGGVARGHVGGWLARPGDPRVVHEHVEPGLGLDRASGGVDARVAGHVELDEAGAQLLGGGTSALAVARAHPDVMAGVDEPPCGLVSEALVRSGDECRWHASMVPPNRFREKGTLLPGTRRATLCLAGRAKIGA